MADSSSNDVVHTSCRNEYDVDAAKRDFPNQQNTENMLSMSRRFWVFSDPSESHKNATLRKIWEFDIFWKTGPSMKHIQRTTRIIQNTLLKQKPFKPTKLIPVTLYISEPRFLNTLHIFEINVFDWKDKLFFLNCWRIKLVCFVLCIFQRGGKLHRRSCIASAQ